MHRGAPMHAATRLAALAGALAGLLAAPCALAAESGAAAAAPAPTPLLVAQAGAAGPGDARALHPIPDTTSRGPWSAFRSHVAVGSVNGDGLDTHSTFGWRRPFLAGEGLLSRDSHVVVGLSPRVNPSFSRIGPVVELQPIAFFHLSASAEYVRYFSTFGNLQSFASPRAEHSDRVRARRAGDAYATGAIHATVEPTLQMRVGSIAARARVTAEWWDADLSGGDPVFYASNTDVLAPDRGWVLTETADVLLLPREGLVLGARWTRTHALYRDADFLEGERRTDPNGHARAGLLAAWSPGDRGWTIGRPTAFVLTGWYLEHRYRARDVRARAIPNVVFGLSFEAGATR